MGKLEVTKEQWAYIAGIIDGEGTIQVARQVHGKDYFVLEVSVTNNNPQLCSYLKKLLGGYIFQAKVTKANFKAFRWGIKCQKALEALRLIRPYLVIKKAQAELAIQFQEHKLTYLTAGQRYLRKPEHKEYEVALYQQLKEEKKKGYVYEVASN